MLGSPTPNLGSEFALALGECLREFSLSKPNPCLSATKACSKSPGPAACKEREQLANTSNSSAQSSSKQKAKMVKHSFQGIRVLFVEDVVLCDRIFTALNK